MRSLPLAAALLSLLLAVAPLAAGSAAEAAPFLLEGNKLLSQGSYAEAARQFGDALQHDPSYVTHYKRATAYLSLGRSSAALDDFDAILRLNPAFAKAHLEKGKIFLKEGNFESAQAELKLYVKASPADTAGTELLSSLASAQSALASARKSCKRKAHEACIDSATHVLEVAPALVEAREMRAASYFALGDVDDGIGELSRLASLNPSSVDAAMRVATTSFFLQSSSNALSHLKACLHYDPDSPPCLKAHRQFKAMTKQLTKIQNFLDGNSFRPALNLILPLMAEFDALLETYHAAGRFPPALAEDAVKLWSDVRLRLYSGACRAGYMLPESAKRFGPWCDAALTMKEDDVDGLVGKGERLLKEESWEEAVRTLEAAFEAGGRSSQDIANRVQRAQKLLKQSKAKDYYKVIGVPRSADDRTIKKAYRKAAKSAHPDKGGSEAKMAALNEAWEVLSKPELKARYDAGDDPNDPQSQQQGHGGGFHHGSPFGGGDFGQFFQQQGGGGGGQHFSFRYGG